jgi:hypothetical protein
MADIYQLANPKRITYLFALIKQQIHQFSQLSPCKLHQLLDHQQTTDLNTHFHTRFSNLSF